MKNRLIFRTEKDQSYFVVANEPFNDERLSWGARGILAYLLSKPDTWQSHLRDLVRQGPDGDTRVKKYLSELAKFGYLRRLKKRDKEGKIRWITEIYESPELNSHFKQNLTTGGKPQGGKPQGGKPQGGKPPSGKPPYGKPSSGKTTSGKPPSLVNTEEVSTDLKNTDLKNTDGTDGAREERKKAPPTAKTAAAAAEFLKILNFVSGQMAKPLQAPESLLAGLAARGETPQSTKNAWQTCQINARNPSGAFVYWLKSGHLPLLCPRVQQTLDFKAKAGEKTPPSSAPPPPLASSDYGGHLQLTPEERKARAAAELAAMQAKTAVSAGDEGASDEQKGVEVKCAPCDQEAVRARKKAELAAMLAKMKGGSG